MYKQFTKKFQKLNFWHALAGSGFPPRIFPFFNFFVFFSSEIWIFISCRRTTENQILDLAYRVDRIGLPHTTDRWCKLHLGYFIHSLSRGTSKLRSMRALPLVCKMYSNKLSERHNRGFLVGGPNHYSLPLELIPTKNMSINSARAWNLSRTSIPELSQKSYISTLIHPRVLSKSVLGPPQGSPGTKK